MDRTIEKLGKFSEMVMQESNRKKNEIIKAAEHEKDEIISSAEIKYLKSAYEKIQEYVRKINKDCGEEVSKAILESKQALFNRRDEIIDAIFEGVRERLVEFAASDDYPVLMKKLLIKALEASGEGDIRLIVDEGGKDLFEDIRSSLKADFKIEESDESLIGGFLIMNKSRGLVWDYSFSSKLADERARFLERYELNIE